MHIAYFSKVLNVNERKYSKTENECLPVLYAVINFRPYLYGRGFVLACDYEPLHWIKYVENLGVRLLRWRIRLQDYLYKFAFMKGNLYKHVEALSVNPITWDDTSSSFRDSDSNESANCDPTSSSPFKRFKRKDLRMTPNTKVVNIMLPIT